MICLTGDIVALGGCTYVTILIGVMSNFEISKNYESHQTSLWLRSNECQNNLPHQPRPSGLRRCDYCVTSNNFVQIPNKILHHDTKFTPTNP